MKVLVCGDRNWTDFWLIENTLRYMTPPVTVVIHGGCRGADYFAGLAAVKIGKPEKVYPAQWDKFGKAAGPIRNIEMLEAERPDLVIAFHSDIKSSKGTAHCLREAKKRGIATMLVEGR